MTSGESRISGTTVQAVVLYADLRRFSEWANTVKLGRVGEIIKVQYERVIQICNDHHPCFHKFLGDGFLLLWEVEGEMDQGACLRHAIDAAFHIHKKYWYFTSELTYEAPRGFGIGMSIGSVIRIQPETFLKEFNAVDFVGYPLNCGARMQMLSEAFGVTLCSSIVALISSNPDDFLYPDVPGFRRRLHGPSQVALRKARSMNGLTQADQTGFRHLTWPDAQQSLWKTDGIRTTD
jgi:class 3 adenylate cyclase